MDLWGWLLVGCGLFSVTCAAIDAEFFMNSRKARGMTMLLGRSGARVLYVIIGAALIVVGVLMAMGLIHDKRH